MIDGRYPRNQNLRSFAVLVDELRVGHGELRALLAIAGVEPDLTLNTIPYYSPQAVERIRQAMTQRHHDSHATNR